VFARDGSLYMGKQAKVRAEGYTWGKAEIVTVLRRWAELPGAARASFVFVTDGRLGPTGKRLRMRWRRQVPVVANAAPFPVQAMRRVMSS
jgi:hypothetical protein